MADDRLNFRPLYILITPGRVQVHIIDPGTPKTLNPPYVFIVVRPSPDGNTIRLECVYVYGPSRDQKVRCNIPRLDLLNLLVSDECTVIEKLKKHYLGLTQDAILSIIKPRGPELNGLFVPPSDTTTNCTTGFNTDTVAQATCDDNQTASAADTQTTESGADTETTPTSQLLLDTIFNQFCDTDGRVRTQLYYPGETNFEKFMNAFMVMIAAYLFVFGVLRMSQARIRRPFFPIEARPPPVPDCPEEHLTRSVGEYISYYAQMLVAIARGNRLIVRVGPSWLGLVAILWRYLGELFTQGNLRNPGLGVYDAILGFAVYQERKAMSVTCLFRQFEQRAQCYISESRDEFRTHMDDLTVAGQTNLKTIECRAEELLEEISERAQHYLNELETRRAKAMEDINSQLEAALQTISAMEGSCERKLKSAIQTDMEEMKCLQKQYHESVCDLQRKINKLLHDALDGITTAKEGAMNDIEIVVNRQQTRMNTAREEIIQEASLAVQDEYNRLARRFTDLYNQGVDSCAKLLNDLERKLRELTNNNLEQISVAGGASIERMKKILHEVEKLLHDGQGNVQKIIGGARQRINDLTEVKLSMLDCCGQKTVDGIHEELAENVLRYIRSGDNGIMKPSREMKRKMRQMANHAIEERIDRQKEEYSREFTRMQLLANRMEQAESNMRTMALGVQEGVPIGKETSHARLSVLTRQVEELQRSNVYLTTECKKLREDNEQLKLYSRATMYRSDSDLLERLNKLEKYMGTHNFHKNGYNNTSHNSKDHQKRAKNLFEMDSTDDELLGIQSSFTDTVPTPLRSLLKTPKCDVQYVDAPTQYVPANK